MRGVIAEGTAPSVAMQQTLEASPSMEGLDLASRATTPESYTTGQGPKVVAYDFGMKRNIVRMLEATGLTVEVVPADTTAEDALARKPDGIFLSNGPGDPAAVAYAPAMMAYCCKWCGLGVIFAPTSQITTCP